MALPLRWTHLPHFRALYLRREATYLGDAIDKSKRLYPHLGARLVLGPRVEWRFPSGATIWFNHCEHESDVSNYDSFEFGLVLFDELTHFAEKQFDGICARLRSTDPAIPCVARAATNPGGIGHEWVKKRWSPWLDRDFTGTPAAEGEIRWRLGKDWVAPHTPDALTYTFIPATLDDNPHIDGARYRAELMALDPVRRAQLLHGDWSVKPAAGLYFKRLWVRLVDAVPVNVRWRVRYWDLAAGGDWAVGVRMSVTEDGVFVVEHVVRLVGTPGEVRAAVEHAANFDGADVPIVVEQDPGQAGKDQIFSYAVFLGEKGFAVYGRPKRTNKITAFGPFSAQAQVHNVLVVRGAWNDAYFDVLEAFPEGDHDDDVDATSGAHAVLCGAPLTDPVAPPPPESAPDDDSRSLTGFASR